MLLTPEHRRSNRKRVKREVFNLETFIQENKIDRMPGKLYRIDNKKVVVEKQDDIYDECPEHSGYEYDKDMYLANDRYAEMVDNDIAELKERENNQST